MTNDSMNKIHIYYTNFKKQLPDQLYKDLLSELPIALQEKNMKYKRWQDRHSNLFGKLLLLEGLKNFILHEKILNKIYYNQYSRPFINGDIDFNISHSGEYVLCAIGKEVRLGIDIEEIKEIKFDDFKQVMTSEQWDSIKKSHNPICTFFKYWTIKESVIKADSRGLSIPLLDININNNEVCYDRKKWYLKELKFDNKYSATLAADKHDIIVIFTYMDFYESEKRKIENCKWEKTQTFFNPN